MKRFLLFAFLFIVFVVAGLLIAPQFMNWNSYKSQISRSVKSYTGYDITIDGDLKLALLPVPYIYSENIQIFANAEAPFMALERLDVSLKPLSLLKGQLVFASIELIRPDITIEKNDDGRFNFLTEEIGNLSQNGQGAGRDNAYGASSIVLENVAIESGRFLYKFDPDKDFAITDINADLKLESLEGPFSVQGGFSQRGKDFLISLTTNKMDESRALPLNLRVSLAEDNAAVSYAGIASFDDENGPEIQGEIDIQAKDLARAIDGYYELPSSLAIDDASLKGLVTASLSSLSLQNTKLILNDAEFDVSLNYASSTMEGQPSHFEVIAPRLVNLDSFIASPPKNSVQDWSQFDPFLPHLKMSENIFKDKNLTGRIVINELGYKGQLFSDITLDFEAKDNPALIFAMKEGPGKTRLESSGTLVFEGDSPYFRFESNIESENFDTFIKNITSINPPFNKAIETGGIVLNGDLYSDKIKLKAMQIRLNDFSANVTGTLKRGSKFEDASMDFDIKAEKFQPSFVSDVELPRAFQNVDVRLDLKGPVKDFSVLSNIQANTTEFIVRADVADILKGYKITNSALQVKNKSLEGFLSDFSPKFPSYETLQGPLDFYAAVKIEDQSFALSDIKAQLSRSSMDGALTIDMGPRLSVTGQLNFPSLIVQNGQKTGKNKAESGPRWSSEPIDFSGLRDMDLNLGLSAAMFSYEAWNMQDVDAAMSLKNGTLKLEGFDAQMFGGEVRGDFTLTSGEGDVDIRSDIHLNNVQIEDFVQAFVGEPLVKGQGLMSFHSKLSTGGRSVQGFVSKLNGNGDINGKDILIEGIDLPELAAALSDDIKPKDTIDGLLRGATRDGQTQFDQLTGKFDVQNGIVRLNPVLLNSAAASINITGTINLPRWEIDTSHSVSFPPEKNIPEFTIEIEGPLDNPSKTFGQGLLEDFFKRKIERKVQKTIQDKLGDTLQEKLGIPLGGPLTPSNDNPNDNQGDPEIPDNQNQPPSNDNVSPEDVFRDVLEGVLSR